MDWLELLNQIFQTCIIPLLGILLTYLLKMIQVKKAQILERLENETIEKYVVMLNKTITECVVATNQTYVDELKDKEAFNKEAQKTALQKTYNAIMSILTEEARDYLTAIYYDLDAYILTKIEAEVRYLKK